ncbi:hypothetical protein AVEN_43647-1 [Araneus ventricosus]|uniref:Uncharacterized protein n=1 Tax=Araneus ventricosus TaxID=182803 RepID=A0A4Y2FFG4_ARAVE|nr:hypothetical protein AVEN_43647-1 [Araneus ventricosus]
MAGLRHKMDDQRKWLFERIFSAELSITKCPSRQCKSTIRSEMNKILEIEPTRAQNMVTGLIGRPSIWRQQPRVGISSFPNSLSWCHLISHLVIASFSAEEEGLSSEASANWDRLQSRHYEEECRI